MRRLCAVLGVVMVLGACGDGDLTIETTSTTVFVPGTLNPALLGTFDSEFLGISAQYPLTWTVVEENILAGLVEFFAEPVTTETERFIENYSVEVIELPEGVDLAAVAAQDAAALPAVLADFEVVGSGPTIVSGVDAVAVSFTGTGSGVPLQVLRLLTVVDQKVYFLTFWASADEFENFLPLFEQLANAFVITG